MNIAISGSSGFVGKALSDFLSSQGHNIKPLVRKDFALTTHNFAKKLDDIDVMIHLAGAPIFQRWTKAAKKRIFDSRINTTKKIVEAINLLDSKPKLFISTSAIGIYKNNAKVDETSQDFGDNFLAEVCKSWEKEALKANTQTKTIIFRFGVILGDGGMLKPLKRIYNFGLGGRIGLGKQGFSWIHLSDLLNIYQHVIENYSTINQGQIFNIVSPYPVSNQDFNKILGKILKRPAFFIISPFMIRLLYKNAVKLVSEGSFVFPNELLNRQYIFKYPKLADALQHLL